MIKLSSGWLNSIVKSAISASALANADSIYYVEDAAQGFDSYYNNNYLGNYRYMDPISFHKIKNISWREGSASLVSDNLLLEATEIMSEKRASRKRLT